MTVRSITKTTLSVVILIIGFVFFRKYYVELLSKLINSYLNIEDYASVIIGKLFPKKYIGAYFPALFYCGIIIIIAARMLEAILNYKVAIKILSSFTFPLFLTAIITVFLCIDKINILQLWAIFYFCMLICLHSTFKKISIFSEAVGKYANLKLFKGFVITIKDAILKVVSTGIPNFSNPIDEAIILLVSAFTLLVEVIVVISFTIYLSMYWRIIFLSHLIN